MKIPQWAIEAAIKGGWKPSEYVGQPEHSFYEILSENDEEIALVLLTPDFWQRLGKELGWGNYIDINQMSFSYARRLYDLILSRASDEEIAAYWDSLKPHESSSQN